MKTNPAKNELSNSQKVAAKTLFEALKILKKEGGELPGREIINKIRDTIKFNDWEKERYEKSGYIRWESIFHFYSIDFVKAGFLRKQKGMWILTDEGEKAIKLGKKNLLLTANERYKEWASKRKKEESETLDDEVEKSEKQIQAKIDKLEEEALQDLMDYVRNKNAYEFQDLVAALLRGMGYYTPFISTRGGDGGLDIIAYQDQLGVNTPRIKVQVKHKPDTTINPQEVRALKALINKQYEIGLFITSGRFSDNLKKEVRGYDVHVRLIDFDNFITLWTEIYDNLSDEDKNILPIKPIYFLGSNE